MTALRLLSLVLLSSATACDDANSSSVTADYDSVRLRQLSFSDAAGKTLVVLSAEPGAAGSPRLLVRDPKGKLLQTIEIGAQR
jgi:hypothetical protein